MSDRLRGRFAIVTGAADGMGKATAQIFADQGAKVLAVDIQADGLEHLAAYSRSIVTLQQDITEERAAEDIVALAQRSFGGIDILVNNAGIRGENRKPVFADTDENWAQVMKVNVEAAFKLARAAASYIMQSPAGRIINIASIQGLFAAPTLGTYAVSKHALIGLTRALALDMGPKATVNAILPGFIETGLTRNLKQDAPEIFERVVSKAVLKRIGQPIEIANAVLFLASGESSYISGACIPVDGGATCW